MRYKKHITYILITGLLCVTAFPASASLVIRPKPVDNHQHNRRAEKIFTLTGQENSTVTMLTPDLQQSQLKINNGEIKFKPTGKDNYHVIIAKRFFNNVQQTAIRYVYSFGKPTGKSPSELTGFKKSALEIIPAPLPREHWHYKAGHQATFDIHFKGKPVADTKVSLSTSHASLLQAKTSSQGRVVFDIPDDFAQTHAGDRANQPGDFLVHVKHTEKKQQYATWLSADYQVDPAHWRNTQLGVLVAAFGFTVGLIITGSGSRKIIKKNGDNK